MTLRFNFVALIQLNFLELLARRGGEIASGSSDLVYLQDPSFPLYFLRDSAGLLQKLAWTFTLLWFLGSCELL